MASFFSGWIGYGTSVLANVLQEPSDANYVRPPIRFSALENGLAFDVAGGTVGPASASWGILTYAGLFDAQGGGNLLAWFALSSPVTLGAGKTFTTSAGVNVIFSRDLRAGATQSFPPGTTLGVFPDGRQIIANIALQVAGGVLSAQNTTFGSVVTMATLPTRPLSPGSGQLWNNGGIITIA